MSWNPVVSEGNGPPVGGGKEGGGMPYRPGSLPRSHTEFGGGEGLIDPKRRADRVLAGHEECAEIYATDPSRSDEDLAAVDLGAPRKGIGAR